MATSIGSLFIKLTADTSELQTRLKAAGQLMNEFGRQFSFNQLLTSGLGGLDSKLQALSGTIKGFASQVPYVGGASAGAVEAGQSFVDFLFKSTTEMAGNIKSAEQLGIEYNTVAAAARKGGISVEEFATKWRKVDALLGQASLGGSSEAKDKLKKWGLIGLEDKSGEEAFRMLADRYKELKDPMLQAAMLQDLGIRNSLELGKAMRDGAAGVDLMAESMRGLSKVEQEEIKEAVRQKKISEELFENMKTGLIAANAPRLTGINKEFQKLSDLAQHPSMIKAADLFRLTPQGNAYYIGQYTQQAIDAATKKVDQDRANKPMTEQQRLDERKRVAQLALDENVTKATERLKAQADAMEMGAEAAKAYAFNVKGATDAVRDEYQAQLQRVQLGELQKTIVSRLMAGRGIEEFNAPHPLEFGTAAAISEVNRQTAAVANQNVEQQVLNVMKQVEMENKQMLEYQRATAVAVTQMANPANLLK
jgi:hypothetical protein